MPKYLQPKMKQMGSHFTIEDLKRSRVAHLNQHIFSSEIRKRKSKYHSRQVEVDGIRFESEKEAARYGALLLRMKAGEIGMLELQVPFELNAGGKFSYTYVADFVYRILATGEQIVEDAKGYRTREYKKKRRLMKKIHGISILET